MAEDARKVGAAPFTRRPARSAARAGGRASAGCSTRRSTCRGTRIGFWLRGDGKGGRFKLQLRDGEGATDYYIDNDYEGWRYHQLPRPQEDPIDYSRVRYLAFYYNVLPGKPPSPAPSMT